MANVVQKNVKKVYHPVFFVELQEMNADLQIWEVSEMWQQ